MKTAYQLVFHHFDHSSTADTTVYLSKASALSAKDRACNSHDEGDSDYTEHDDWVFIQELTIVD